MKDTTATSPEAQESAEASVTIATHPGVFHADDAMAVAILRHLMPHARVSRTAEAAELAAATYVVDVGGIHAPKTGRYDHHQVGAPVRADGSPYAAAGLVWADKGWGAVLATLTGEQVASLGRHIIDLIAEAVDAALIRHIDAADNGKRVDGYTISQMVAGLNPVWGELDTPVARQAQFAEAVWLCQRALVREIKRQVAFHLTAQLVSDAWDDSPRDAYPGILLLEQYMPWQDAVAMIPEAKLVVFPSLRGGWNVQVIEKWSPDGTKTVRCPLPDHWHGLTDAALEKASEIAGATFCHKAGFLASHSGARPDGAMKMASMAIAAHLPVEELAL